MNKIKITMSPSRLEQLFEFQKEEPDDPFILYAIATEYQKTDVSKALEYFNRLLTEHESYTGTYYQAAKLYESLGRNDEARNIYRKGIDICRGAGKPKAVAELMSALNSLSDEEDRL
jgi:tetratricopeptide (TPR) repeat protein